MKLKSLVFIVLVVTFTACSSLKKQAKENYEKGNYEQSYRLYKQAHEKDKKDSEIKAGLKKALKAYLNQKLVGLRNIKNKKSVDYILQEIAAIEFLQKENKEYLDYNSQQFYGNELKKSRSIIIKKWDQTLDEKNVLKYYIQQYHYSFLNLKKDQAGKELLAKIKKIGVSSCNSKIKSSERDYFINNFLVKYCGVFGRKVKFKRKTPVGLVKNLTFDSNVNVKSSQKKDIIKLMELATSKKLI